MANQLDYLHQLNAQFEQLWQQMNTKLTTQEYGAVLGYIAAFSYNTVTSVQRITGLLGFDSALAEEVLSRLTTIGVLQSENGIRCPECNLLFGKIENVSDLESEVFCYGCDSNVEIDASDVEVIYTLQRRC